ncbi:TetR/AcrR family transcriptional regulator [Pseudoalteromonas pernae]|uniref:TetR/AcrR family transcriptional regulator n=1 Tax=Pseudoalteromonas pernae TaxID=3118054 RepID=UPI00324278E7
MSTPQSPKKLATRGRILESAWTLFLAKGYAATSTRDIATHANIGNGTLFSHFENKEQLLRELMLEQLTDVIAQAKRTDEFAQPKLKMRHYAQHLYDFYLQHVEFSKTLLQGLIWQADFFSAQMEELKTSLFSGCERYDEVRAAAMIDCYFMTLLEGLNSDGVKTSQLVSRLSSKLALL